MRSRAEPLVSSSGRRRLARRRPKLHDRLAAPGDNHLFTGKRLVDQAWKPVLGVGNTVSGHVESPQQMAVMIAIIAACVQKRHKCRSHGDPAMRLLIAMMKHETNTFSPVPTPLARFGPLYGEAAVRAYLGTGPGRGARLDLGEGEQAGFVLPLAAGASPSGPVEDAAYAHITDTIREAAACGGF